MTVPSRPPRGLMVCFLAPDGAGKSTLVEGLAGTLPVAADAIYMGLQPAGRREIPVPGLRLVQRIARQWRGYLRGRRLRRAGAVALFDRYSYDALLAPARPRDRLNRARRALLGRIVPPPDLAVILDAPPELLHARRPEHGLEELARLRDAYRELAERLPCRAVVVDASGTPEAVRSAVAELLLRALQRAEDR